MRLIGGQFSSIVRSLERKVQFDINRGRNLGGFAASARRRKHVMKQTRQENSPGRLPPTGALGEPDGRRCRSIEADMLECDAGLPGWSGFDRYAAFFS